MYSRGNLHTDEQRLEDKLRPIYNNSVLTQDVALKTNREQWTIEMRGEGEPWKSVLLARHDVNDMYKEDLALNNLQ